MNNKQLVLIVDDETTNLQALGTILQDEECQFAFATSGWQALSIIYEVHPDLILLDVVMPGLNGFEVCKILKDSPEVKDIPVIFLTAKTALKDIIEGFSLGAVDYVIKPFNSVELLARVHTHLELKKARDEQKKLIDELQVALAEVKLLKGFLPICCFCKKIRDDEGYWQQLEEYITKYSDTQFTHGVCPECLTIHYSQLGY